MIEYLIILFAWIISLFAFWKLGGKDEKYQNYKKAKKHLRKQMICAIMLIGTLTACVRNGSDLNNSALCTLEPIFYDVVEPQSAELELLKHNEVICGFCYKKGCEG